MDRRTVRNALVPDDVQIGRLLELDGKSLAQRAVEDRLSRRVDEIREDEGVARGERWARPGR